jgi:tetratricopeptide (TPR) repeat protein
MKTDPVLCKAARLARSRNYTEAIKILDSEENRYIDSYNYFYLYAVICLYSGDFGGALAHFRHAYVIKNMKDPPAMLGLAALYMNRKDTVHAVDYYLDVEELDPGNRIAQKGLAIIRKYSEHDSISAWLAEGKLHKLYPPIPNVGMTHGTVASIFLAFVSVLLLTLGLLVIFHVLPNPFKIRSGRPTAEFALSGQERDEPVEPVETSGLYRYILTRNQILDNYDKALSFFTSYRDEAAKICLNRILESNASENLKNKSRLLLAFMETPRFDNFKHNDNVSYANVAREPVLYRDVYVIWKGMATNVEVLEEQTTFDFLVGYDTRTALEGIVPVVFNSPVALNGERPLEVLGKIVPLSPYSMNIRLEGAAIYQSGILENKKE